MACFISCGRRQHTASCMKDSYYGCFSPSDRMLEPSRQGAFATPAEMTSIFGIKSVVHFVASGYGRDILALAACCCLDRLIDHHHSLPQFLGEAKVRGKSFILAFFGLAAIEVSYHGCCDVSALHQPRFAFEDCLAIRPLMALALIYAGK